MAGYQSIVALRRLEKEVDELGLMLCAPKSGSWGMVDVDNVAVKPKDEDSLPIYARDAELFSGSLEQLRVWLRGVQWAREYDRMLMGKAIETKRERKEQDYRNQRLMQTIKDGKLSKDAMGGSPNGV